ncbi:response regulator [Oceaniglobus trochenteri]|uniref:response regulator n=1 Tax=Oceaniglobus trochenteri TaxID=2763260 RepID=UPI001CFFEA8E|nr:response regulator [Oceaniglobus trochenteri]
MKILAVDDDDSVLQILRVIAERAGYSEIVTVTNAGSALEQIIAAQTPFECILLDIQMPVMDGVELCDLIRRIPDYHDCPIIMITAMSDQQYVDQAFAAGATDFVTKPFDVHSLVARLTAAADSGRTRGQATGRG